MRTGSIDKEFKNNSRSLTESFWRLHYQHPVITNIATSCLAAGLTYGLASTVFSSYFSNALAAASLFTTAATIHRNDDTFRAPPPIKKQLPKICASFVALSVAFSVASSFFWEIKDNVNISRTSKKLALVFQAPGTKVGDTYRDPEGNLFTYEKYSMWDAIGYSDERHPKAIKSIRKEDGSPLILHQKHVVGPLYRDDFFLKDKKNLRRANQTYKLPAEEGLPLRADGKPPQIKDIIYFNHK